MEPHATVEAMLFRAAEKGDLPVLQRLLAADPGLATCTTGGCTPLLFAAYYGQARAVRLLLEVAPAEALTPDEYGSLPLHGAAGSGNVESVRLLLEATPAGALTPNAHGWLPLHMAAARGSIETARLLLEVAPAAAEVAAKESGFPLEIALDLATIVGEALVFAHLSYLITARLLLPATPPERALSALLRAGDVGLPLFADLAACRALSPAQWRRVPGPCPGLGAALPAVLARSVTEAALLVGRLPAEVRARLRTGALCLGRAQRERRTELPAALVGQVLALAAGP